MSNAQERPTDEQLKVAMTAAWERGAASYDTHWATASRPLSSVGPGQICSSA